MIRTIYEKFTTAFFGSPVPVQGSIMFFIIVLLPFVIIGIITLAEWIEKRKKQNQEGTKE